MFFARKMHSGETEVSTEDDEENLDFDSDNGEDTVTDGEIDDQPDPWEWYQSNEQRFKYPIHFTGMVQYSTLTALL